MEKSSYVLRSNYFDKLRHRAREIEEGIDRLNKTWKTPFMLIGGYADCDAETIVYLEELWQSVRGTNDAVEKFQSGLESSLVEANEFLEDSETIYNDLKEQCDNIDVVLAEYGYHYEEDNNVQENNGNDNNDQVNKNILTNEEMSDIEIEFTPDLTWKCKAKSKRSDVNSDGSQRNSSVRGIATPVIKSLASVFQTEVPARKDR